MKYRRVKSWGLTLDRGPATGDGHNLEGGTHPRGEPDLEEAAILEGDHEGFTLAKGLTLGCEGPTT